MTWLWAQFGRLSRRSRPALCIALLLLDAAAPPRAAASASSVQSVSFVYEDVLARPHYDVALGGHDDLVSEAQLQSMLEKYVRQAAANRQREEDGEEQSRTAGETKGPNNRELGESGPAKSVDSRHVKKETSGPRTSHPESEGALLKEPIVMRSATGQRYVCLLPQPAPPQTEGEGSVDDEQTTSNEDAATSELKRREALEAGLSLLDGMEGHCLYLVLGWFTVEYCHNAHIRQYHQPATVSAVHAPAPQDGQPGAPTYNFYLGRHNRLPKSSVKRGMSASFTGSKALPPEKQDSAAEKTSAVGHVTEDTDVRSMDGRLFISLRCHGGTICDKTGKPRTTEVQFFCNMQQPEHISQVLEPSTCKYIITIQTPRLCRDSAFVPPQPPDVHTIKCNPVVSNEYHALASGKNNKLEVGTTDVSGGVKTGAGTDATDQHGQHQRAAADAEDDEGKGVDEMKPVVNWKAVSLRRDPLTGNFIIESYLDPERSGSQASSPQREENGATAEKGRPTSDKGGEVRHGLSTLGELFIDLEDVVSRVTSEMQRSRAGVTPTSSKPKSKPASHLEKLERSFREVYDTGTEMKQSRAEAETEDDEENGEQEGGDLSQHRKEGAAPARDEL